MSKAIILLPGEDITALVNEGSANGSQTTLNVIPVMGAKGGRRGQSADAKSTVTSEAKLMIGPGLKREDNNRFVAVKCGQLVSRETPLVRTFWMDSHYKRYTVSRGDRVVGFVVTKQAYHCKVDIGTNEPAVLSLLAFPQATKRNKPAIEVGDAVYAQITTECPDIEPELVCVNSEQKSGGLGVLSSDGYVLTVPISIVRRLLAPDSQVIRTLGSKYKFEISCGMNGRIWIRAKNLDTTLTIVNFMDSLEHIPKCQYQHVADQLVQGFEPVVRQ